MSRAHVRSALIASVLLSFSSTAFAQEAISESVVVRADRLPTAANTAPFRVEEVTTEELRRAPQLRLDDVLRAQVPGFSLFRRSSSRAGNPTTQGVTLRNFGPSGAGRTLVLLDGIPLNDPFAGYVLWNQAPPASLDSVFVTPGGGAGLFGNAALAGTIFLESRRAPADEVVAEGTIGNRETFAGSIAANLVRGPASFSAFAEHFTTGGYPVLQSDQRGPVDTDADSESDLLQLGARFGISMNTSLQLQVRGFQEERGNGTLYTRNDTKGADISAVVTTQVPQLKAELRLTGYAQQRKFRSTFSSVNETRDVETPALDQFDVPAVAAGGSAVWSMALAPHIITLGADVRWVEGETREAFRFIGNDFTRIRTAGGEQFFLGVFAEDSWQLTPAVKLLGSARLDHWRLFDASRLERDRATGATTLANTFPDRDGTTANGRLGASIAITEKWTVRATGYTGFRVPTLNELYRPFRVGNAVTEANAQLEPERLIGAEAGVEWRPTATVRLGATTFYNRLEDAVGNITIGFGPGIFDPGGFIPAGGVLRQRQNVELVVAPGAEFTGEWSIAPSLLIRGTYLFTEPTIERAAEASLIGKLLAQTPQHVGTVAIEWRPAPKWLFSTQARYLDRQFEDDQNSIELAAVWLVDAAIAYDFTEKLSAAVKIENVLDAEVETGKQINGLVSIGAPRLVSLRVRCGF